MLIARVAAGVHWHALEDDVVVGRGHALHRPDGRVFVSVDTWRDDVFTVLASAMLEDLGPPVHTVVDDDDREVLARWSSLGFVENRREVDLLIPTAPAATAPATLARPSGVRVLRGTVADERRLHNLDRALREEIEATLGWHRMPAEVARPRVDVGALDPARHVVTVLDHDYVGLMRIAPLPRRPRLGMIGVRTAYRRRGLARTMLIETLRPLHAAGITGVSVEVDRQNTAALALFASLGARRIGGALELVQTRVDPPCRDHARAS